MAYTQLTQVQRYQISVLLKMEHTQTEIANSLGVHKSTISRELKHNRGQRGIGLNKRIKKRKSGAPGTVRRSRNRIGDWWKKS